MNGTDGIRLIANDGALSLVEKLTQIAEVLSGVLNARIYFCEIIGKRWSYVAGSGDITDRQFRWKINDSWGLISDVDLSQNHVMNVIVNLFKEMLSN